MFNTTIPGEYALIFSNMQSGQDLTVTLALHTYEENKVDEIKYDILADGSRVTMPAAGSEATGTSDLGGALDDALKEELLGGSENMAATDEHI